MIPSMVNVEMEFGGPYSKALIQATCSSQSDGDPGKSWSVMCSMGEVPWLGTTWLSIEAICEERNQSSAQGSLEGRGSSHWRIS